MLNLREDMHVHSTVSDGKNTLEENLAEAEALSLTRFGCVEHVRLDTSWVPEYVARVQRARTQLGLEIWTGVEAKLLDQSGTLDMPQELTGVHRVYVADHRFPLGHACYRPIEIKQKLESGELTQAKCFDVLVESTLGAIERYPNLVIAHLFSILPKLGVCEADVPRAAIAELARACVASGTLIEVDERWRSPSAETVKIFVEHGVPVLCSSDAHRRENIGRYTHNAAVASALLGAVAA
jgi:putative hydrolase